MIFITLFKWKTAPTKDLVSPWAKVLEELEKQGIKIVHYWTLGRYDAVMIIEAPSEKDVMKILLPFVDLADSETMTAVPREEAIKLL